MKIYDSVHGFIHFNELEAQLIDTPLFQRLRYIHQLGISYLVYPGGTHTRFEHSLGTMHLATLIFDQIAGNRPDKDYWRQAVRMAALCHDMGHLPFSHVAEKQLLGLEGHEAWTQKMIESTILRPIWENVARVFPGRPIVEHVLKLAIGEKELPGMSFSPLEKIYSQIVTGDFFGSDRIDYLLRDAKATGLSYGLFDYMQLIEMLVVIEEGQQLSLGVDENGIESCEALLLARHFMQRRVYQYDAAKAYSFHLARFMKELYSNPKYFASVEGYISMSEHQVLCSLEAAKGDSSLPGHLDARCLFDRKSRFKAIHLPKETQEEELESYKENSKIASDLIHWDLAEKYATQTELSLPIRLRTGAVAPKEAFSHIAIPPGKKNWLYLSPEYDFAVS